MRTCGQNLGSLSQLSDVLQRFSSGSLSSWMMQIRFSKLALWRSSGHFSQFFPCTEIAVKHRRVEIETSNFDHMFYLWFSTDEWVCLPWNVPFRRGYGTRLECSSGKSISQVPIDMILGVTQLIETTSEIIWAASAHTTLETTPVTVKKPRKKLIFKRLYLSSQMS